MCCENVFDEKKLFIIIQFTNVLRGWHILVKKCLLQDHDYEKLPNPHKSEVALSGCEI